MPAIAILIDPLRQVVEVITFSTLDLASMKTEIGCGTVTRSAIGPGLDLWLDDEGMFAPGQRFWSFAGEDYPYAGKGLVLEITPAGDCRGLNHEWSLQQLLSELRQMVFWIGDKHKLEEAIRAGVAARPQSTMTDGSGHTEVLWTWTPDETPDDPSTD